MNITMADLNRLCPHARGDILSGLAKAFPAILPGYGITTGLRFSHFIAQAAHETMGLSTLNELGGAAYFEKHYGPGTAIGKRLGNTEKGDGARYHGRGIFQLTGRDNYRIFGAKIGLNLVAAPEQAADPAVSLKIACEYWKARGLNALADRDDIVEITRRINGGANGLAERRRYLADAKAIWLGSTPMRSEEPRPDPALEIPAAPIAQEPATAGVATSPDLWSIVTGLLGSGGAAVLSYVQSPWALIAFLAVVALFGFLGWRVLKRHDLV